MKKQYIAPRTEQTQVNLETRLLDKSMTYGGVLETETNADGRIRGSRSADDDFDELW